jgi:uncharacterized membrane protein YphA (DoxX/SURF4 family)
VDRLYSKFPIGSVGLALFLLRLADGFGLVAEGSRLFRPVGATSETASAELLGVALVASAVMLILGLRTTLAGGAAAACTAGSTLYGIHYVKLSAGDMDGWVFLLALVFVQSSSLALAGPGGYSLDARLSGWRTIRLSSGKSRKLDGPERWETFWS